MRIELKDFQEEAVRALLKHVRNARHEARDGDPQAIILSSPTGSGKTITITALMERILEGAESYDADPKAVFLWLSDSPELNSQSRDKLVAQSSVFRDNDLIIVEPPFSRERFEPGKVYFLNTQKMGKDNLLTKTGDGRDFSIWQTIENTAQTALGHFFLIIDEAHRGMNLSAKEIKQTQTIVQKFIFGDPIVGLSPVKIIIGISATPERFARVLEGSTRTKREYIVPPFAVRESGLLKDRIVLYCPKEDQPSDWTLLSEAARRWRRFCSEWRKYCKDQGIPQVDPVLVIQVEDGTEGKITRTDLAKAVEILEREAGQFGLGSLAHCFEIEGPVVCGGNQIRKIEPSKIQQDAATRVVFFKMALSTGWDCPRAEVMMSFRKAKDHTSIAQLVGRMVRTPLARRVEGNELLNGVPLYLPHYDRTGLKVIVDKLNDPESAPPTEVVEGSQLVTLTRHPKHKALFRRLAALPSYSVERIPKTSNTRRLIKLARQLTFDEIVPQAWDNAKSLVIKTLAKELKRLKSDPRFSHCYRENQVIEISEVQVEVGDWKELGDEKVAKVKTTPENIDDLFEICGRMLGEGLHQEFWKTHLDRVAPQRAKLELFGILQDKAARQRLEEVAQERIAILFDLYKDKIAALPSSKREEYNRIRRRAKEPQTIDIMFPETLELPYEEPAWDHHLYVDDKAHFGWNANSWETEVLRSEMAKTGFVAWLRNYPRKPWSFCVPYVRGGEDRPLYPDLLIFRRVKGKVVVDILDPHDSGLRDAVDKAIGLARFAEKHGDYFGRIELIILGPKNDIKLLDVNREAIREKVKVVTSPAHLDALFTGQTS
ncbi:MAG: Type III restriction enzyme, res subunit [Candidatus Hydrogenedentes bacterium ADurb.Bin179]|nr:MAG: Type III restriction enzyme, res subunit [Candidatus Hydrogenedentes bacterium ADurb.Bin179]